MNIMRRSNHNFNIPPHRANLGHLTTLLPGEWWIWQVRPFQGGKFDLCLVGVGKIEPEVYGFKWLFLGGTEVANSYKQVFGRDGRV